jgi:TolA-binding protein
MMSWRTLTGPALLATLVGGSLGCEKDVETEVKDLRDARERAPQVVQELRDELSRTERRASVLREKLKHAEEGLTDEVLQERADVEQALEEQEQATRREVRQVDQELRTLRKATDRAERELERPEAPVPPDGKEAVP